MCLCFGVNLSLDVVGWDPIFLHTTPAAVAAKLWYMQAGELARELSWPANDYRRSTNLLAGARSL